MTGEQSSLVTNLRKVITLVDHLSDVGLNKYINLPRIVVLGSQSSGKSSLLEQIVGLDFLPRGEGTVTRRPLELRMVYVPIQKLSQPYGVFEEIKGQKFTDFEMVKINIDRLTDKVAGNKKGIVDKPIVLTIFSSTCPDLTIIDLPGITKIPIRGSEQNQDVEMITKEMAARYCRDLKTIILCVIPANADITTSDGLLMARQIDPQGLRTIGVITKIDIMDKGTDAKRLLHGEDVALRLGYVGVKNRSQADINTKKTVLQSLEEERKFFSSSPVYSSLPSGLIGTRSLTNKLTEVLYSHIRTCLPDIIDEIQKQISQKEARLKELGQGLPENDNERLKLLWGIINDFTSAYRNSINGNYDKLACIDKERLPAGHRIRQVLNDLYADLRQGLPKDKYSESEIRNAILKYDGGDNLPGCPNIDVFLYLLTPLLKNLKEPAFECINEIYLILEEIANNILTKIISKAPALKEELQESILNHFKNERDSCIEKVDNIIESEIGYIFTNDVEYLISKYLISRNNPVKQAPDDPKRNIPPQNPASFGGIRGLVSCNPLITELRCRVDNYFSVVIRGIKDSVPKMIGFFLVKASQTKLQQTLFDATKQSDKYFNLMAEPDHLVEERKTLSKAIETLKASIKMIRRDPDFSTFFNKADTLMNSKLLEKKVLTASGEPIPQLSSEPSNRNPQQQPSYHQLPQSREPNKSGSMSANAIFSDSKSNQQSIQVNPNTSYINGQNNNPLIKNICSSNRTNNITGNGNNRSYPNLIPPEVQQQVTSEKNQNSASRNLTQINNLFGIKFSENPKQSNQIQGQKVIK